MKSKNEDVSCSQQGFQLMIQDSDIRQTTECL
jgi:hypothetical protein